MVVRFLLDTNTISEPFKVRPNSIVVNQIGRHNGEIAIASVTWHELLYGLNRNPDSQRKRQLEQYIRDIVRPRVTILNYGEAAAEWFARERSRLTGLGRTPSYPDGQIAAIAAVANLTLVTRNVSDYRDFEGLRIENWFS